MTPVGIDFFHDVVCCWCFNLSSRMRDLADEFDLDIRHRTFVLQASPQDARDTILGHWAVCRQVSDRPERVNIDAMRAAPFDYPHGMTAALGCKAAERLGGQAGHWDMFVRLQRAHLTEARNVAAAFVGAFDDPATARAVAVDRQHARALQVRSVPPLMLRDSGTRRVNGPRHDLAAQLRAALRLVAGRDMP